SLVDLLPSLTCATERCLRWIDDVYRERTRNGLQCLKVSTAELAGADDRDAFHVLASPENAGGWRVRRRRPSPDGTDSPRRGRAARQPRCGSSRTRRQPDESPRAPVQR